MSAAAEAAPGNGRACVLEVEDLRVRYGELPAVDGASLRVARGQVVALIGETGSGKSSFALGVARLLARSAVVTGGVRIADCDLSSMSDREFRLRRAGILGYIAQDAMAALNPVQPVGRQIGELFRVHRGMSKREAGARAVRELTRVRIDRPELVARRYPHQLSGGMRQRVMIAMAVALSPPLLIADESTTALDVSTQADILALLGVLKEETSSGILWITHDMGVVAELADWVAVMYAGRIVEQGPVHDIFDYPRHPYTEGLLQTRRDLRTGRPGAPLFQIEGAPPALSADRAGCAFAPRCPRSSAICAESAPALEPVPEPAAGGQLAACHHPVPPGNGHRPAGQAGEEVRP
ncbi:MAG: ABC transporter ATP-binding protein [Streptosporangiaceae bacterium]